MALATRPRPSPIPSPALAGPYRAGASVQERRFDPRARAEARQRAAELPAAHWVELIRVQREESRRSTQRLRDQWSHFWRVYQSWVRQPNLEDWQSDLWLPLAFSSVEQADALMAKGLLDSPDVFGVEGVEDRDRALADLIHAPLIRTAFRRTKFPYKFLDATKLAFIGGQSSYLKFRWAAFDAPTVQGMTMDESGWPSPVYGRGRQRSYLTIEVVPPWQVFRDPDSAPREPFSGTYLIHQRPVGWPWLSAGAEAGLFVRMAEVKPRAGAGGSDDSSPTRQAERRGQTWERHRFRKDYVADEWYGDLLDPHGEVVYPDAMMTSVNDVLVFEPHDTPLIAVDPGTGRRKWPLIGWSVLVNPLRFEGHGLLEMVEPFQRVVSALASRFVDGLNWSLFPEAEVDLSILENADDLERFPGKLWLKRGQGQAFSVAQTGRIDGGAALSGLQYFTAAHENGSFVNQFVQGAEGTRSNITKGEVEIKTGQSMTVFEKMAKNLESAGADCVELTMDFHLQYLTDWSDPSIAAIVGPKHAQVLSGLTLEQRLETLGGNFDVTFPGLSGALQRSQLLGRLMQFLQLASQPDYKGLTNPADRLMAVRDGLGLGDQIEVSESPMVPLAEVKQVIAQLMGSRGAPPGAGPGAPGPGPSGPPAIPPPTMRQLAPTADEEARSAGTVRRGGAALPSPGAMEA